MSLLGSLKARLSPDTKQAIKNALPDSAARLLERTGTNQPEQKKKRPKAEALPASPVASPVAAAPPTKSSPKPAAPSPAQAAPARPAVPTPPPIPPGQAIQWFERSGLDLSSLVLDDDGLRPGLLTLAQAYARHGNIERALRCIDYIPPEARTVATTIIEADLLAKMAQFPAALEVLGRVRVSDLSGEALRKLELQRMRWLRLDGQYGKAVAMAQRLVEDFPNSPETMLAAADTLILSGELRDAETIFEDLVSRENLPQAAIESYADYLHDSNQLRSAAMILRIGMGRLKGPMTIQWRLCRHCWTVGDQDGFNAIAKMLGQRIDANNRLPMGGIAFFSMLDEEPGSGWTGIGRVQTALDALLTRKQDMLQALTPARMDEAVGLLNDALASENEPQIAAWAEAVTKAYPWTARGWYAMGRVELARNRFDAAERAFRKAIDLDPVSPDHYAALFNLLASHPGKLAEMEELIATRNVLVPKFNERTPDGRQRFYDHESLFLNFIRGDYLAAYALRNNQPPNRWLEKIWPDSYRALAEDALPDTRGGTVCVIGQDGVGDEIRWAQYYPRLADHFDRVEVACDPRLVPIFERSFPEYGFTGVARRWPSVPWRSREERPEIAQVNMAGKLNGVFAHKFTQADRIMFPEEVAWHLWRKDGVKGPAAAYQGPYLRPNPDLAANWEERLAAESRGRLRVGLLWRSGLVTPRRAMHFMSVRDFAPLTRMEASFVSLQPKLREDEASVCERMGIQVHDDLDLYDDFEGIAALTSRLDLVIGISTLPLEMAAGVGTECWTLCFAPYARHIRLGPGGGDRDINTANGIVICGDEDGSFALPHAQLVRNCVQRSADKLKQAIRARHDR
jgi:tetratricopeptide (TPR) repeat protein